MKKFLVVILCGIVNLNARYQSQFGQDRLCNEYFFKNKRDGVFIDIGAHDGKSGSNTYFFEKELGWSGICFEPLPHLFEQLVKCRDCICINACVSAQEGLLPFLHVASCDEMLSGLCGTYDKRALAAVSADMKAFGGEFKILQLPSIKLNKILEQYNINHIDLLSVDTEGSELEILETIDFNSITIDVITVENNYHEPFIGDFLKTKNYTFVMRVGVDDIYVRNDLSFDFHD